MESNALTVYNATDGTNATTATTKRPQDQETVKKLQILCQSELQMGTELGNPEVFKATGRNAAKRKRKTKTRLGVKDKATNLAALKMIARQGADEKSQLEEWKNDLLHNLTKKIA